MAALTHVTTDHDEIRRWAEERGGRPSAVVRTEGGLGPEDPGIIRLDFPGYSGEGSLEEISWDDWFAKFDEAKLAFVFQDETAGGEKSNFNKLVGRETAMARARGVRTSRRAARSKKKETTSAGRGRSPVKKTAARRAGSEPATKPAGRRSTATTKAKTATGKKSPSTRRAPSGTAKKGSARGAVQKGEVRTRQTASARTKTLGKKRASPARGRGPTTSKKSGATKSTRGTTGRGRTTRR